jgi:hypothetical protein
VIRLQAGQLQVGCGLDRAGEFHHRAAGRHAATTLADVDIDHQRHDGAGCGGQALDGGDIAQVIDTGRDPDPAAQFHQRGNLAITDDLVADEDVADAGVRQRYRLADLLHTDTDRACSQLAAGDLRALVALGVRPQRHPHPCRLGGHQGDIRFEGLHLHDQSRGVDVVDGITGTRRQGLGHLDLLLWVGAQTARTM